MTVIKVLSKAHCPNWVAGIVNDNAESIIRLRVMASLFNDFWLLLNG